MEVAVFTLLLLSYLVRNISRFFKWLHEVLIISPDVWRYLAPKLAEFYSLVLNNKTLFATCALLYINISPHSAHSVW